MSISRIINNWFKKNKHLFFTYRDGFYHLNFVANSPRLMIESFKKMLFCKHDALTNTIFTDSPFNRAKIRYAFLEEGLAIINYEMIYKKNVSYHQVINEEILNDYYTLSFNVFSNQTNTDTIILKSLSFSNKKWILTKPSLLAHSSYFKNSEGESIIIYFNQKWLENYIQNDKAYCTSKVKHFFESDEEFVVWPDNIIELSNLALNIQHILKEDGPDNSLLLKYKTFELISSFIRTYDPQNIFKNYKNLNKKDLLKINKVEFFLMENIQQKFIGIEKLSQQFSISPTKLKSDFKSVYGIGIFTYYRKKQMKISKELLEKGDLQIQEVAQLFGYENRSKFSKAFESVNGILPSKVVFSNCH